MIVLISNELRSNLINGLNQINNEHNYLDLVLKQINENQIKDERFLRYVNLDKEFSFEDYFDYLIKQYYFLKDKFANAIVLEPSGLNKKIIINEDFFKMFGSQSYMKFKEIVEKILVELENNLELEIGFHIENVYVLLKYKNNILIGYNYG